MAWAVPVCGGVEAGSNQSSSFYPNFLRWYIGSLWENGGTIPFQCFLTSFNVTHSRYLGSTLVRPSTTTSKPKVSSVLMKMGIISRSQLMTLERRQCSWEEQQWSQSLSGSQQSPNQWVRSRKNVGIYARYYKNSWAEILRKKPSLYMKEVRNFIILFWELC